MYSWLAPNVIFPAYEAISGRRPWTEAQRLLELQWRSADELQARSAARLRKLVEHASASVPYYRELFACHGITAQDVQSVSDLSRVPRTSKEGLRAGFPERVLSTSLPSSQRIRRTTSGSSGQPFEFYDDRADLRGMGTYLFFQQWAATPLSMIRLRIVSPGWLRLSVAAETERWLRRLLTGYRALDLSNVDVSVDKLLAVVRRFPAGSSYLIGAYPSYVARLASELMDRGMKLPIYPTVVVVGGETITPLESEIIRRGLRCRLVDRYGSWEAQAMAQTCPDNPSVFHVNSERVILRVVREDGTSVDPGEEGQILLTHLNNRVMPLINYDLGDRAVAGAACSCGRGFPVIQSLQGRTVELIKKPSGGIISPGVLCNFMAFVFPTIGYVSEFQAFQSAPDAVSLRLVPGPNFNPSFASSLVTELRKFFGAGMAVTIEVVDRIAVESSGKRLIIKSGLPAA